MARRSWWGWGNEGEGLSDKEVASLRSTLGDRFGVERDGLRPVPALDELQLDPPKMSPPASLEAISASDVFARASHTYGKSYRDLVRSLSGILEHPPDLVMRPRSLAEVEAALDWCSSNAVAVVPFGGGSSVVGGVEPDVGEGYRAVVSLDLTEMSQVLEVDDVSMAARIQAGTLGPSLEDQLRRRGLTLRHFPQSFEFSTLGGWIATRSGGHFATGPTHIDDLVESMLVVTPAGRVETRRLPASGAGPSPDRLFLGSEGALGVVTEAWMKVRVRPRWRSGGTALFETFAAGARSVRALVQSGLQPSNCRLVDPLEASVNGAGDGTRAVLLVGFESAEHPVEALAEMAKDIVGDHGGALDAPSWYSTDTSGAREPAATRQGAVDTTSAWRRSFMRAPYLRDALVRLGVLCDTFETAVTWDRFEELHEAVSDAIRRTLDTRGATSGFATCRVTHAYPDGAAPYFTVVAPTTSGSELEDWSALKGAVSTAMLKSGGTITHHHAVGRDHRPWYDEQRPPLFAAAVSAAKSVLDPAGICNPGVLLNPTR